MDADDLGRLKQEAVDKIIFHATPREWLKAGGPWVLDRGAGALLYDTERFDRHALFFVQHRWLETNPWSREPIRNHSDLVHTRHDWTDGPNRRRRGGLAGCDRRG